MGVWCSSCHSTHNEVGLGRQLLLMCPHWPQLKEDSVVPPINAENPLKKCRCVLCCLGLKAASSSCHSTHNDGGGISAVLKAITVLATAFCISNRVLSVTTTTAALCSSLPCVNDDQHNKLYPKLQVSSIRTEKRKQQLTPHRYTPPPPQQQYTTPRGVHIASRHNTAPLPRTRRDVHSLWQ